MSHSINIKAYQLYLVTIILAGCSLLYELLLAQTLSTIMGDTIVRYNITIGLYIASLGIGSIVFPYMIKSHSLHNLAKLEIILAIFGGLGPIFILIFDYFSRNYLGVLYGLSTNLFNHSFIILIGFLSGIELPFLIKLGKRAQDLSIGKVLFLDYLGSFLAAIIFPLFLMPFYSLFTIAITIALANTLVALFLLVQDEDKKWLPTVFIQVLIYCLMLLFAEPIGTKIIKVFYL
jgi:spermidine synthase